MSEPKVEFDLNSLPSGYDKEIFDQLRRWHEFREDRGTPAIQTFEGTLIDDAEQRLYVPGQIYGYSGMSQITGGYWVPMTYSAAVQFNVCYFGLETENQRNNFLTVRLNSTTSGASKSYKVTVFYRGNADGN